MVPSVSPPGRLQLLIVLLVVLLAGWGHLAAAAGAQDPIAPPAHRPSQRHTARGPVQQAYADIETERAAPPLALSRQGLLQAKGAASNVGARAGGWLSRPTSAADLVLGDVILVATVEGGLYGLDRITGAQRWGIGPGTARAAAQDGFTFGPLVETTYGPSRRTFAHLAAGLPLLDELDGSSRPVPSGEEAIELLRDEIGLYVVEPSSAGDIYVLTAEIEGEGAAGHQSLHKLPLTLPQLVELSPFSFPGDEDRVFVGHKSTSLVELDLSSGRIGAVFGSGGGGEKSWRARGESGEQGVNGWTHVGRTEYVLTVHSRRYPDLSQTLRHSTFAPNAADQGVAQIWAAAARARRIPRPIPFGTPGLDERSIQIMPEEGSLVCFNLSRPTDADEAEGQERTLWTTELGGSIAGIYDVVRPAPHLAAKPRAIIVPHPRVASSLLFGENAGLPGRSDASREPTYLGIAEGSLYAMSGGQFPLVTFSPPALSSLPSGASHEHTDGQVPARGKPRPCTSFGCWIGSYEVDVDSEAERRAQSELLGIGGREEERLPPSQRPPLAIDGGSQQDSDPNASLPTSALPDRSEATMPPLIDPPPPSSTRFWHWRPTPTVALFQLIAILAFGILLALIYIGLQEQARQSREAASAIAKDVVWVPAVLDEKKTDETSGPSQDPEAKAQDAPASEEKASNGAALANGKTSIEALLEQEAALAAKAEKKRAGKRRRRGKRAGAAVAARDAKRAANGGGDDDDGEGDDNEDEEEEGGENGRRAHMRSSSSKGSLSLNSADRKQQLSATADPAAVLSPVTAALVDEGWIDAGAGSATAEEQLVRLAASASAAEEGAERQTTGGVIRKGQSLVISDEVLGYGSSGTVVFRGTFQGRAVAVKRLLRDFVNVASKEVSLLESADNHPNVIRYFYKELTSSFLYIALELCPASLADVVEKPNEFRELGNLLEPKKALSQITSGLRHLHSLSIVHRDIKPQNVLVAVNASGRLKMLLSDFGLSKKLDGLAQTSFSQTMNNPGGTVGWRAPEILRGDVRLDAGEGSTSASSSSEPGGKAKPGEDKLRLTRAVDIFALGCLAYYVLSNGDHPFGSRFEREINIVRGRIDLGALDGLGEEGHEAQHLVAAMTEADPRQRPSASDVLAHPYFWDAQRRLNFLQDASDRFEIMERDPPDPHLVVLETNAPAIVGSDWYKRLDKLVTADMGKFRSYDGRSVQHLLRFLRNKKHHWQDMPAAVRKIMGTLPFGFLSFFTTRYPKLFLHVYTVIAEAPVLRAESLFAPYFEPLDRDH